MKTLKTIAFWILFPLFTLIVGGLLVFYLDMANGPLVLFIIEAIVLALFIFMTIFLRKRKLLRWIPLLGLVVSNIVIIPLAKPSVEAKPAFDYANPVKTDVMSLANGKVQGVYNKDKTVEIYAGIPYAKPPVGELRWKEPVPVENWEGVRDCSYFAPRSMQPGSSAVMNSLVDLYSAKAWHPDWNMHPEQDKSEDSLYLNIWKPANAEGDLPILVYIHGGSLTSGSSGYEDYNGEVMAEHGVIMITITYRLGIFGFFGHPDLKAESPNHTTGNYGLLDQIEALRWVKNNAPFFGGDANNITIAGESAGSSSVSALCSSPLAHGQGLFRRAIGESSSLVVKTPPHTFRSQESAYETSASVLKEFNCNSIDELRKIPAEKLVTTASTNSSMMLDEYSLPRLPYEVYEAGENNEVALLNGYNVMESDAFVVPTFLFSPTNKDNAKPRLIDEFGEKTGTKLYDLYKDKMEEDAFTAFNEIISVYWFMHPHESWTRMALQAGETVYRYQFTKENRFHSTYHGGEMIYAYGNVKKSPFGWRYDETDEALAETMVSYWANFAKTGDPNGEGLPRWEAYDSSKGEVMELGSNLGMMEDRYKDVYPIIDEYIEDCLAQAE